MVSLKGEKLLVEQRKVELLASALRISLPAQT
jgi:hypothetical protein